MALGQFTENDIDPVGAYRPGDIDATDQPPALNQALSGADLTSGLPGPVRSVANALGRVGSALSMNTDVAGEPVGGVMGADAFRVPQSKTEVALDAMAALPAGKIIGAAKPTVVRALRNSFPEIYSNVADLVREAASRVAPESPLLRQLFGVTRDDLFDIAEQGAREGNLTDIPFKTAANPKGAGHAIQVMNPRNVQRLQDIIGEAQKYPQLYQPMASWYTMDPAFKQFQLLHGDDAVRAYNQFNSLVGMASPGSEVMAEINRGTAANWLANEGRFEDFKKYGGVAASSRGPDFPPDMSAVTAHPYHPIAHVQPMEKYLASGAVDMGSAKVPSYIQASGVPETGFQTRWPVGDAHWSRLVGLPDVRSTANPASASVPEMVSLGPWWAQKIAKPMGLEAVPAQAVVWGAGSGATGVTSPIGAGKLELLAVRIGEAAKRLGISPEKARDLVLTGKAHAALAGSIGAAAATRLLSVQHPLTMPEKEYESEQ